MLSEHTIDSYRAPVFNTHSLCLELLNVLSEIEDGFLHSRSAQPIVEELIESYKNDIVVKEILGKNYSSLIKKLETYKNNHSKTREEINEHNVSQHSEVKIKQIRSLVHTLYEILNTHYLDSIKNLISHKTSDNKEKENINFLARILISELQHLGYSKEYLYNETQSFFFSENKIERVGQIHDFLSKFSEENKKYDIIIKINKNIKYICQHFESLELEIIENIPQTSDMNDLEVDFYKTKNEEQIFVKFKAIKALDQYQAQEYSKRYLLLFNNLLSYKAYKEQLVWESNYLLYSEDGNISNIKPITSPRENNQNNQQIDMQKTMEGVKSLLMRIEPHSSYSLINSLNLHTCSLQSKSPENQLINLWTAMETLLPPPINNQKILHFTNSFESLLGRKYIQKLLINLYNSLKEALSEDDFNDIFSQFSSSYSDIEKISMIISIKENKPIRKKLYSNIKYNPLLINRVYSLNKKLASSNSILETINQHNKRVRWQLQRIYRGRNRITHKGENIQYISPLLENTYAYYHTVIDLIIEIRKNYNYSLSSLENVFNLIKIEHEAHIEHLTQNKDTHCSEENFKDLLFGN